MTNSKILVVDDEAAIRNFLVRVLQIGGYHVQSASNGNEALKRLENTRYDLLLTDIKMDQVDGVELLRTAKRHYPDLAVILLTGHASVPSAVAALRHGAHDYLLKPAKNEDILLTVSEALNDRARKQRRDRLEVIAMEMLDVVQPSEVVAPSIKHRAKRLRYGALELNLSAFKARLDGQTLELTPTEFRLLVTMARVPGETIGYVRLVQSACGYVCARHEAREIIGTHVINLRKKMGIERDNPLYIESIRGIGYRLVPLPHQEETSDSVRA